MTPRASEGGSGGSGGGGGGAAAGGRARRPAPAWPSTVLTGCLAAALGLTEGLADVLGDGTSPALHRAPSLLGYAMATWLVPLLPLLLAAHLGRLVLRRRSRGAHVGCDGLALGVWVGFGGWIDGRGVPVAAGLGLAAGGLAAGLLAWLLKEGGGGSRSGERRSPLPLPSPRSLAIGATALLLLGWAVAGLWLAREGAPLRGPLPAGRHRPNLLLLVADTLRADALSAYGGSTPTPHIDRIGREGWIVEDAVSTTCWTLPAVASIWTSLEPRDHGVSTFASYLSSEPAHLAEHLRQQGYVTAAVVANQLLTPQRGFARGFDAFEGYTHAVESSSFWVTRLNRLAVRWGWLRGEGAGKKMRIPALEAGAGLVAHLTGYMTAAEVDDTALELLDRLADRDFALWVHYFDPHDPYLPHPVSLGHETPGFEPRHRDRLRDLYAREVASLDRAVGRLLAAMEHRGLLEDTLVVFTADHGEEFLDHGGWTHGKTVYDEVVRVPLLVRFPGGQTPGPAPREASLLDVAPTVLSVMALPELPGAAGIDLTKPPPPDRVRFAERIGGVWWMVARRRGDVAAVIHGSNVPRWTPQELLAFADRSMRPAPAARGGESMGAAGAWSFAGGRHPFPVPRQEEGAVQGASSGGVDAAPDTLVLSPRPGKLAPEVSSVSWAPRIEGFASLGLDVVAPREGRSRLVVEVQRRREGTGWTPVPGVRVRSDADPPGPREVSLPPLRLQPEESYRLVLRVSNRPDGRPARSPRPEDPGEALAAGEDLAPASDVPGTAWRIRGVHTSLDDLDRLFPVELYDLARDPHEQHDLVAHPRDLPPELLARVRQARREILLHAARARAATERRLTPEEERSLSQLGYLR